MSGLYAEDSDPRWVYEFRDAAGHVLYVGCTVDFPRRLRAHALDKPWFGEVVDIQTQRFPDLASGWAEEKRRILALRPIYEQSSVSRAMRRRQVAS